MNYIVGGMNSQQYLIIPSSLLLPALEQVADQNAPLAKINLDSQEDNDPDHTSAITKDWLASRRTKNNEITIPITRFEPN